MRRIPIIFLILGTFCGAALAASAQESSVRDEVLATFAENRNRAAVNACCYEFRPDVVTAAPKGYKPVYVSHLGRHGSRTDWSARRYRDLAAVFTAAGSKGLLTDDGRYFLEKTQQVFQRHGGNDGALTLRGQIEHKELARRIYAGYKPVFTKGCKFVRAESSSVPRCLVSMSSFVESLASEQPDLEFTMESLDPNKTYIGNICSDRHKKESERMLDSLMQNYPYDTTAVLSRFFTDPAAAVELVPDVDRFCHYLYYVARIAQSEGVADDLFDYLPDDLVYRWWDYDTRKLFFRHGNSVEFGAERMALTRPLVKRIFETAQEALDSGRVAADLRFSHDYPTIAVASYLGFEGFGEPFSFDEVPSRFHYPHVMPFAGNLQLVLYRNKAGRVLVKAVYCGAEQKIIGLTPVSGPYYDWNEFKAKYDR